MLKYHTQILLIMLFVFTNIFSQDITYTVKHDGLETDNRIHQYKTPINKGLQKSVYNFVIKNLKKGDVIQIENKNIEKTSAFQQNQKIRLSKKQRFVTYTAINNGPLELKIEVTKEAFIPLKVFSAIDFMIYERNQFMFIGFYYGFVMIIIVINLFYFFSFKDKVFLYYALFVLSLSIGLIISDGIFYYLGIPSKLIDYIEVIDHVIVSFFSIFFVLNFMQAETYIKYIYYWFLTILFVLIGFCITNLITGSFIWYVLSESLVFTILGLLWLTGLFLYKNSIYIKVIVIAYVFILVMGIDYYVLKLFGLKILGVKAIHVKIGGFIEMIFLSYAVVYRMKTLKVENEQIQKEVYLHLQNIKELSLKLEASNNNEQNYLFSYNLSIREMEIAELIVSGKTNQQIADHLFISINTVKTHVRKIYEKLKVRNRKEVAIKLNT